MEMNVIVAGVFMLAIAGVVGYDMYKNIIERNARKAEMSSLQKQINTLTQKLKDLNLFKG